MELLGIEHPVLDHSQVVLVRLLVRVNALSLNPKLCGRRFGLVFILDPDYIFLVVVDNCEEFPLDLGEVLSDVGLVEESSFLLEDEV